MLEHAYRPLFEHAQALMTPVRERSSREEYLHWVHQFIAVARNKGYADKANSIPSALRVCSCDGILKNNVGAGVLE